MGKRFLALFLSALIVFTEITSGQIMFSATEVTEENGQSEDGTVPLSEGVEEEIVYFFPFWDKIDQLPDRQLDIGRTVGWQNRTTGDVGEIEITGISQSNEAAVSIEEWEDGTGWSLRTSYEVGTSSKIYLAYNDKDGKSEVHTFTINVCSDMHIAAISNNSNGVGCATPGESLALYAEYSWQRYWVDEEGGRWFGSGDTSNVQYQWSLDCGEDVATIDATGENATVSFVNNSANLGQLVTATLEVIMDGNVVTTTEYHIEITEHYYYIKPLCLENSDLEIGETCEVTPELWHVVYTYEPEAESGTIDTIHVQEGVRYAFDWDTEAVCITDSNGKVLSREEEMWWSDAPTYTLEKLSNYYTDVIIEAVVWDEERQNFYPETSRVWSLNQLQYNVWFNDIQNHVFMDENNTEELIFNLNTDWLQDKENYELEWRIGSWDEEDNCTPIENGISFNEEKTSVTFDTKEVWDELTADMNGQPEDTWFHICVRVLTPAEEGEEQVELFRLDEDINLCKRIEEARLHDLGDREILPCWNVEIGNEYECYVRNEDYQGGENIWLPITSVEVANAQDDKGEGNVAWIEEHEGGWTIWPNRTGHAIISFSYQNYNEETINGTCNLWVTEQLYEMDFHSANGTDQVLPDETYDLNVDLRHECYNPENNEHYLGDISDHTYRWFIDDESLANDVSITFDGTAASVSVNNNPDLIGREIPVVIQVFTPDSQDSVTERRTSIWITDRYLEVQPAELNSWIDVYAEFTFAPSAVWHVYDYKNEQADTESVDGVRYYFNWDSNAYQITDANGIELNGEDWENQTGTAPFTIKKLGNWDTDIELIVFAPNDNGDYEEINRRNYRFGTVDYHADFRELNAGDHVRLWADEAEGQDVDVVLNMDNYANKNVTIEWNFGYWDGENFDAVLNGATDAYTLNGDKTVATLHANALLEAIHAIDENRNDCSIHIVIKVNGQEVHSFGTWAEVREERVEYRFEGLGKENQMLPHDGRSFGNQVEIYTENAEYPDGYSEWVTIENFTVENASDDEGEGDAVTVTPWEDSAGWDIHANRFGHAIATFTFKDLNGDTVTENIDIWVCDEIADIEIKTSTENIVPGETIVVDAKLRLRAYSEERGHYEKDTTGYRFEWENLDDYWTQYATINQYMTEDGWLRLELNVTGDDADVVDQFMGNCIPLRAIAYAPQENGGHEVRRSDLGIWVVDCYQMILPVELDTYDLAIGEEMTYEPTVEEHKYIRGDENEASRTEITTLQGIEYAWGWDETCIQITDAEGNVLNTESEDGSSTIGVAPFTIKRLDTWGTEINCNAMQYSEEEGGYQHLANRGWHINEVNYNFDIDNIRGDGQSWVYLTKDSGEDYTVTLQPHQEGILDACDIEWTVGKYEWDGDNKNYSYTATPSVAYTVSEDGSAITIHTKALADELVESNEEIDEAYWQWFNVTVVLKAKGTDKVVSEYDFGVEIRPEVCTYFQMTDFTNLPTGQLVFVKNQKVHVEDANNPYGEDFPFEVVNVEVETVSVEDSEHEEDGVLSVEAWEDGTGWTVTSLHAGEGRVIVTYKDLNGDNQTHYMNLYVKNTNYSIAMNSSSGTHNVLPGATVDIYADLLKYIFEDGEIKEKEITGELRYEWSTNEDDIMVERDAENPNVLHVSVPTAEECGWDYWFDVNVDIFETVVEDDGEVVEYHRSSMTLSMYVCDRYYQLLTEDIVYIQPGETIDVPAVLKYISLDCPEGEVIENVIYGIYKFNGINSDVIVNENNKLISVVENANVPAGETVEQWYTLIADMEGIHEEYSSLLIICNHEYEEIGRLDETCTDAGYIVRRCAICEHETIEERDALGHKSVVDKAVAATCTETGLTEGSHCSRCNKVLKEQTVVKALGHNNVTDKAVAATCTETGLTEGTHCSRCSTVTKAQTVVKALGHNSVVDKAVAPTCTTDGKTEGSHCSRCNTVLKAQTAVKALGHNSVVDKAVAPTCTTDGKTEGSHCSRCNTVLKAQTVIKATGHSYEEILTKATMSADGSIVKKCKTCGNVASTTTIAKIASVTLADEEYTYNGKAKNPAVTVKDSKGAVLAKDKDYTVNYASGCKNPGQYEVKVTFIGNYEGTKSLYFTIAPKAIKISSLTPDKKTFTAKWTTTTGSGYEIAYSTSEKFTKSTTKTVTVSGQSSKSKKITGLKATEKYFVRIRAYVTITVNKKETKLYGEWSDVETVITETAKGKISAIKSVTLSEDEYQYDGKVKKPSVIIKDKAGNTLEEGVDYKVSYASGRKNPGSYKVTVTYLGNYKSLKKVTLYFTIAPKGVAIKKLTATSKGFKVTYAKGSNNTGYEIQYSTSKKFTKSTTKSVTISKAKTTSKTISKLKGNKTYYVRIRTYKTVKVNGKSVKVYSDWSGAKSVKTKK